MTARPPTDRRPTTAAALLQESGIVILRDLDELAGGWLRESRIATRNRRGPLARMQGLTVWAYAELRPMPGGNYSPRRYWYRTDRDRVYADWDHPIEAIDPASIRPRQATRQWLGPRCIVATGSRWHGHQLEVAL